MANNINPLISTGGGYRLVAIGTGATYGEQAASLYTAFSQLSTIEKYRSKLLFGRGGMLLDIAFVGGFFANSVVASPTPEISGYGVDLSAGKVYQIYNGNTRDQSSVAADGNIRLFVL